MFNNLTLINILNHANFEKNQLLLKRFWCIRYVSVDIMTSFKSDNVIV